MKTRKAFFAGVAGAAAMTVLGFVVRALGIPANLEMMLGTMFLPAGAVAWVAGLVIHLALGGLFGLAYGIGFERLTHRSGAGVGALFSIAHIVVSGIGLSIVPALHRLIPEQMPAPGMFMMGLGSVGLALFVVEHLIYGAVVGSLYGPVVHPTRERRPIVTPQVGTP